MRNVAITTACVACVLMCAFCVQFNDIKYAVAQVDFMKERAKVCRRLYVCLWAHIRAGSLALWAVVGAVCGTVGKETVRML